LPESFRGVAPSAGLLDLSPAIIASLDQPSDQDFFKKAWCFQALLVLKANIGEVMT
jgi:hypothetical protein